MAISGKYGNLDIPKIGADEPIFILRAQDKLALSTIEVYKMFLASHNSPLAEKVSEQIKVFQEWGGTKKMPD